MLLQKVEVHQGDKTIIKTKPRIERNRVLVTGGAGFVGSHLCTYLVERGDHVSAICCDGPGAFSPARKASGRP